MLKVELHQAGSVLTMHMEGRFVGRFAEDARELLTRRQPPAGLIVEMSEVSFVDVVGEEVLSWLGRTGALFLAETAYSVDVCERLHLPIARKHTAHRTSEVTFAAPPPSNARTSKSGVE